MPRDPTLLGTVEDVRGATVSVALDESTISGLSFVEGGSYRIGQIGGFVRIPLGYLDLFGIISQVGASAVPERLAATSPHGNRWLTIQLVGEGRADSGFERGISQYPTVGDRAFLVTERHLRTIYGRPQDPRYVRVGYLASAESIPALVDIDRLVTRHSAVVGTTGSGKSTTVAGLLASLSDQALYPAARIVVIDIHGEYGAALSDRANVFRINANAKKDEKPLHIPYWALTVDELIPVSFGQFDDVGRGAVLERIADRKRESIGKNPRPGVTADSVTVDTPVPFSIHHLWFDLHCEIRATHIEQANQAQSKATWALELDAAKKPIQPGDPIRVIAPRFRPVKDEKGDPEKIRLSKSPLNIGRPIDRLASRLRDPRFDFLFRPGPWLPKGDGTVDQDLDSLLASWLGTEKPITILDLSGVPPVIQSDLVAALLRIVYEALFWARHLPEGGRARPLLVVLEEAHSYLSHPDGPAAQAVRRIAKEGRKYGIGAMIVSQRPSEVDHTILSQCGTLFAMRLANANDRGHVTSAATDNLEGLFAMLPILRTGEAVIVGEGSTCQSEH